MQRSEERPALEREQKRKGNLAPLTASDFPADPPKHTPAWVRDQNMWQRNQFGEYKYEFWERLGPKRYPLFKKRLDSLLLDGRPYHQALYLATAEFPPEPTDRPRRLRSGRESAYAAGVETVPEPEGGSNYE